MRKTGSYKIYGEQSYFVPHPLSSISHALEFNAEIIKLYGEANFSLGRLNEITKRLSDPESFIDACIRKEAHLSCEIAGFQGSTFMLTDTADDPISYYSRALKEVTKATKEGRAITSQLILETHKTLVGGDAQEHYRTQHARRTGNSTPPPADKIPGLMAEPEHYILQDTSLPPLIKAGLVHAQFETIHPFLDGNGRIGRMLIIAQLLDAKLLEFPCLYTSRYLKRHQLEYYQRLDRVRTHGDLEGWITFYLKAIRDSAIEAYSLAENTEKLRKEISKQIKAEQRFTKMRETAISALHILFKNPAFSITDISHDIAKTYNTSHNIIMQFIDLGLVAEATNQKRNKSYKFVPYLKLLRTE